MHRVGAHVGDQAAFVKPLGHAHRLLGGHAQLAVGFLLECRGCERRRGRAALIALADVGDLPVALDQAVGQRARLTLVEQDDLFALGDFARIFVEVLTRGEPHAAQSHQLRGELLAAGVKRGLEIPVGAGFEVAPFQLAEHQQAHRRRLHAPGGEARRDFLPQQRRDSVADQPVQDAARFLRLDELAVDGATVLNRFLDGLAGDFVKYHALDRHFGLEQLDQVPGDALTFAVFVRRQDELVGRLERRGERLDDLLFVFGHHV